MGYKQLAPTKNLIIFSGDSLWPGCAASNRMIKYAKAIADQNTSVFIISANSSFKNFTLQEFSKNCFFVGDRQNTIINAFEFVRVVKSFSESLSGATNFLYYPRSAASYDFATFFWLKIRKKKNIVIEINERRYYYKELSMFRNIPFVDFPKELIKYIFHKISIGFSEKLTPYFDGMILISTSLENYYKKKIINKKHVRIPILCEKTASSNEKRNLSWNKKQPFRIGYSGQVSFHKENLDKLLVAISNLSQKGYKLTLDIFGPFLMNRKYFEGKIRKMGLAEIVIYQGSLNYDNLIEELTQRNLLVIVRGNTRQNHFGFSTKLSDYLSTGIPVLATEVSDVGLYLKDGINGFTIKPDSIAAIEEKIIEIMDNYNSKATLVSEGALKLVQSDFLIDNYSQKLKDVFFEN